MKPRKYEAAKKQLDQLICAVSYDKNLFEPAIAYTETVYGTSLGTINNIYINDTDPELAQYLFVHEAGHVLFDHTRSIQERTDSYIFQKIDAAYTKVQDYFGRDKTKYYNFFRNMIFNITMDFEVNSRFFEADEWYYFQKISKKLLNNPDAVGMWPQDYGFAPGKTWNEYISLICLEPELFLSKIITQWCIQDFLAQKGLGLEDFNGELTPFQYEKIRQQCALVSRDIGEKIKNKGNLHNSTDFGIPSGSMDGFSREVAAPCHINFKKYTSIPNLVDKVRELLTTKKPAQNLRNQMYNTNRRKYNSNIIIPRNIRYTHNQKPDLYLLIDVSGSVDSKMVFDFLSTFRKFKDEFVNTRAIYWSTELLKDLPLSEPVPNLYGGGTDMAAGVKYINEKYKLKNDDVFFMISDFCDSLNEWKQQLESMQARKYAIDWNTTHNYYVDPGFETILSNSEKR